MAFNTKRYIFNLLDVVLFCLYSGDAYMNLYTPAINPARPHLNRVIPNLQIIKRCNLLHNTDAFWIVSGYERVGKSNLAQALAEIYLKLKPDEHPKRPKQELTLTKEHFIFTPEQFFSVPYEVPRGSPIIVDEGGTAMLANEAITAEGREVKKIVTVMGERNLFVIICAPQWDLLQPYIRARRGTTLLKVVARGHFLAYNKPAVQRIRKDARTAQLVYPPPTFMDSWQFRGGKLWNEYETMKADHLKARNAPDSSNELLMATTAARRLGISVNTLNKYSDDGTIPWTELFNGQRRWRENDIAMLLKEHNSKE